MPSPAHAEWPLPAGGLPWPPPGNEQEVLANPRRYPDSRPGRHAAVKSSYPLITGPSYDDLPPEWPRVKPLKSLMLPDSHFEFVDQSHEAGREYPHEADPRIHSPKFYRPSAARVINYLDEEAGLGDLVPENGDGRGRSTSAHSRHDSGNSRGAERRSRSRDGTRSLSRGRRSSGSSERGRRTRRRSASSDVFPRSPSSERGRSRTRSETGVSREREERPLDRREEEDDDDKGKPGVEDPLLNIHPVLRPIRTGPLAHSGDSGRVPRTAGSSLASERASQRARNERRTGDDGRDGIELESYEDPFRESDESFENARRQVVAARHERDRRRAVTPGPGEFPRGRNISPPPSRAASRGPFDDDDGDRLEAARRRQARSRRPERKCSRAWMMHHQWPVGGAVVLVRLLSHPLYEVVARRLD
ncbi:hypothetical protein DMC30DRAFT_386944 [Rhodotorula diobovata]|uniref:Uncharacterized protein n=1 Tax=Rhodotorula diobovata TaxID=5288 RepID=A0A5C5G7W4_9BASI|nr:hypothetical protein DMC30DRAFT_386944 [Rhodotorula diobovata]